MANQWLLGFLGKIATGAHSFGLFGLSLAIAALKSIVCSTGCSVMSSCGFLALMLCVVISGRCSILAIILLSCWLILE